jgi:hypothetical protein
VDFRQTSTGTVRALVGTMTNPYRDVTYHHHWKLMSVVAVAAFVALIVAMIKSWFLLALVLGLGFAILVVQWITIDPPAVTDDDVHGKPAGRASKRAR